MEKKEKEARKKTVRKLERWNGEQTGETARQTDIRRDLNALEDSRLKISETEERGKDGESGGAATLAAGDGD